MRPHCPELVLEHRALAVHGDQRPWPAPIAAGVRYGLRISRSSRRSCLLKSKSQRAFYALPSAETIARWIQETPSSFRFCPKISRDISHSATLDARKKETEVFTQRMHGLGERLGPMFLQLPPAFSPAQFAQLQAFLDFWPRELRLAVEVRHPKFFAEPYSTDLNKLLRRYNVARVIMDSRPIRIGSAEEKQVLQARERKPDLPVEAVATADFAFVRYIGHPRMEVNVLLLDFWAQHIARWLQQGMTIFAFCHCPFEVHSPEICQELYRRVSSLHSLASLPSQPQQPQQPEQARLF